jgi:predicted Na+-dependent transporter
MPNVTAITIFILVPFFLGMLIEKWMKNKIGDFRRKWQREQGIAKKIKGYLIALFALASFIGVFAIANAFHELGLGKR